MKEFLLCTTAFSLTMLFQPADDASVHQLEPWTLMECDSLDTSNYLVEVDEHGYRAIAECFFGGYYPQGPKSKF